nr:class I SAM-dependent methyltransferase [Pedobacter sp. ASV19]
MNEQKDFEEAAKQEHSQDNNALIFQIIDTLEQTADLQLLEISFGEGKHLPFLFERVEGIHYYGTDTSEDMVKKAILANNLKVKQGNARFLKAKRDGILDFKNDFFDHCFTENTLYFWKNPIPYFMEIKRVLKPGGKFTLSFTEKDFGENLPWTQLDFTFYDVKEVQKIFQRTGFTNITAKKITDEIINENGEWVKNSYVMMSGQK